MNEPLNLQTEWEVANTAKDANQTKQERKTCFGILQLKINRMKMMQRKTVSIPGHISSNFD